MHVQHNRVQYQLNPAFSCKQWIAEEAKEWELYIFIDSNFGCVGWVCGVGDTCEDLHSAQRL